MMGIFLYYIDITFLAYALYNIQILKQKHFLHYFTQIGFPALYTVCRVFWSKNTVFKKDAKSSQI